MSDLEDVKIAKSTHTAEILARPNVVGLGIGYKRSGNRVSPELSVVVMVRQKLPPVSLSAAEMIPQEVGGVRIDVIEVGEFHASGDLQTGAALESRTSRHRPAPGGVSLGHYRITAGTLGCVVRDRKSGARLILSNNHVLANRNEAQPGDPILQPGPADGGLPERDTFALLERFEKIRYNQEAAACNIAQTYARLGNALARRLGSHHQIQAIQYQPYAVNQMDAALARPIAEADLQDDILEIGPVSGVAEASLGQEVMKSGRTTAFTTGTITILDTTVTVNYGGDRRATFEHQIVSSAMSQGGDSGSLLLNRQDQQAVGLLFAGSNQATLFNPIQAVLKALQVEFHVPGAKSVADQRSLLERAQAVKARHEAELLALPNVVGVGVGLRHRGSRRTDEVGLVVMVDRKLPLEQLAPQDIIPGEIEGVPVDVKEVGEFAAFIDSAAA